MKQKRLGFFYLLLSTMSQICFSLPDDKDKPLHIKAGEVDLNQETHIHFFRKGINLQQGETAYLQKSQSPR